jgi:hypothetical protein
MFKDMIKISNETSTEYIISPYAETISSERQLSVEPKRADDHHSKQEMTALHIMNLPYLEKISKSYNEAYDIFSEKVSIIEELSR